MATLEQIISYSDNILDSQTYRDSGLNGLQLCTALDQRITSIAASVDAGEAVIELACRQGAQLLIVHHGLFWTAPYTLTGALGRKVKLLYKHNCALYASHLPLDGHPTLGNAAQLAKHLKMTSIKPFCEYKGSFVGAHGQWARERSLIEISASLSKLAGAVKPLVLPFGKTKIKRVGIVTGSASFALTHVKEAGLDLLISGEPKQECYHLAKELGVSAIFAGHYATETFGVNALMQLLSKRFKLDSKFIDWPTGI